MVITRRIAKQAGQNGGASLQTRKFEGVCVTFTGIEKNYQKNLAEIVIGLGGVIQTSVTKSTTHLVAHKMINEKCFEAYKNHIPIMKSDFIFAVKDAPGDFDLKTSDFIAKYSCKTFENVLVCVSKCSKELQVKIQKAIVAGGGHYSRNLLTTKTDVVIVPTERSEKFKVARQCKIPTVTPDWVFSSEEKGRLLPLTGFQPRLQPAFTSTQINGPGMKGSQLNIFSTILPPVASDSAASMRTAISVPNPRGISVQDPISAVTTQEDWLVTSLENNAVLNHGNFLLSSENSSVDELSSTKVATPEGSQEESSSLQDSSSCVNKSKSGTIIPGTPESSISLFSPREMSDHQKHEASRNFHHFETTTGQSGFPDIQYGSRDKRLKKCRNATSSCGTSSGTSGYTSSKSADRSS